VEGDAGPSCKLGSVPWSSSSWGGRRRRRRKAREEEAERAQLRFEVEFRFLCGVDSLDHSREDGLGVDSARRHGPTFFFCLWEDGEAQFYCVGYKGSAHVAHVSLMFKMPSCMINEL
jgi:hypothetical protein